MTEGQLRFVSYGGGVQSTALLVLAAQRRIDFPVFVMANVGDDSEHPATLKYVREIAMPYAERHGIELHLIDRLKRDGSVETLYGRLMREESRSLPIPVRMSNGAPGQRSCTADFKIRVTGRWAKEHGATGGGRCRGHRAEDRTTDRDNCPLCAAQSGVCLEGEHDHGPRGDCPKCKQANPAVVGIGISRDEIGRASNRRTEPHEQIVYPLIGLGEETGLMLSRQDCANLIAAAGLPVPPKSSCFFCPFHRPSVWDDMARDEPALFERAAGLEDTLNRRRTTLGKDPVYLTRFNAPLRTIVVRGQDTLWQDEPEPDPGCDSGWCMT